MDIQEFLKLMNSEGVQDPRMQMFAQMMTEQNKEKAAPDVSKAKDYEKLSQHLQLLGHHIRKLKKANRILLQNLEIMIARNDKLAEALGACHDCFGEDPSCSSCRGLGQPGHYEINLKLFAQYIQPCLEKLSNDLATHEPNNNTNSNQNKHT